MRLPAATLLLFALLAPPATAREEWYDHYDKALAALDRGEYDTAVELIEAALERKKRSGYLRTYGNNYIRYAPHFQLGVARHGLGDCAAALTSFERAEDRGETADAPGFDATLRRLREECEIRLAPPPVEPEIETVDATPPPASIEAPEPQRPPIERELLERGLGSYLEGDFENAIVSFDALTRATPDSARLRLLLGMALHGAWTTSGETDEGLIARARSELAAAASLHPALVPDPALCPPPVAALYRSLR